jgi:uncharacterized protein YbbC (DUF1343 family)
MRVATGLDRLAADEPEVLGRLRGLRLGLVAHPASVDARLRHARQVFHDAGLDLRALFGPEHGYGGEAQDMIGVGAARDPGGVRIHSLYGASEAELSPRPEWLEDIDALVIDLQDVGSRYYTFVWTAVCALRVAAPLGIPCIVLDRPNPLGGVVVEGAAQRPGYQSFVGLCDVAVRHGMTIGELCQLARERDGLPRESLEVVTMRGWSREHSFEQTGLPWVFPSPNMPTPDTARVYPGGCLIEGTNLSEGRGHTRPFEVWGAPFVDGAALAARVSAPGVTLRPLTFTPTFHKHAGQLCGGVQVHVTDQAKLRSYPLYLRLLAAVREQAPEKFAWRREAYEFVVDRPAIDLLTGGPEYRQAVDAGGAGLDALLARDEAGAAEFARAREAFLLYR